MLGYNNTNTLSPHTNVVDGQILLSGGARNNMSIQDIEKLLKGQKMRDMEYRPNNAFSRADIRPSNPPKNLKMAFGGSNFMQEMMLDTAKKQLKDYMDGVRKTKPAKKYLDVLEDSGIISKLNGGKMSKTDKKIRDADAWSDFAVRTGTKGVDLAKYGYTEFQDAVNPVGTAAKQQAKRSVNGIGNNINKAFGWGLERDLQNISKKASPWISFVKEYSEKNNIPYKQSLKEAGPLFRRLQQGSGYSRVG